MGTSRSFGELERKLAAAARNLEQSTPRTVLLAAEAAKGQLDAEIKSRVPDLDMSGLSSAKTKSGKAKSGKVGTRIARSGANGSTRSVRAVGAVHWLEGGTRAHLVGMGRVNGSMSTRGRYRKAQAKFMKAAGAAHPVRGPLWHPGMKAGHTWSKGVRKAKPKATQVFQRRTVADAFDPFA